MTRTTFTQKATLLSVLIFVSHIVSAQLSIGAGVVPLHASGQSDFKAQQSPIDVFALYEKGNLGIRMDYHQTSSYNKDRFSFTQSAFEVSIQYSLQRLLNIYNYEPYLRLGATQWSSDFTTEGYPGIQDYELKIENDSGYGIIAAAGVVYHLSSSIGFGLEGQYALNGNAQFIAGGFDPSPLAVDQARLMASIQYTFPGTTSKSSKQKANCPKF